VDDNRQLVRGVSLEEYVSVLRGEGVDIVSGVGRNYWRRGEMRSLEREPVWCLDEPPASEVRRAMRQLRALVATYVRPPDAAHPQNALLYVCRNQDYTMEGLERGARKNLRRALRELRFDFVDPQVFLQQGMAPYCETRARIGLSDGTPESFRNRFQRPTANPACRIIGAWRGDVLAAFLTVIVVEDWVATTASGAATEYLGLRPNDGLIHFALDYFLTQHKFQLVTYGLSSIQEGDKTNTLDRFKRKVGFEAWPVHRAFVLHPLLRPFANPVTLSGLRVCTRLWPSSRALRKATGLLATCLGKRPALADTQHREQEDEENQEE
jgi:hypothetical protein